MKFLLPLILYFLIQIPVQAQKSNFSGTVNTNGIMYSGEESPFWMHSNQRGRIDEKTNIAGWINGMATFSISENSRFQIGAGVLYSDGYLKELQLDESFIGFENSWFETYVGRKHQKELYRGLSASNKNILWSLNARPLPGISLQITRPVYFWKKAGLGFRAGLEEFFMDDERYVKDTRLHHKSFHLVFNKISNFELTVGLEHFVQWAGFSPTFGRLPGSFDDYLNVFKGVEGDDTVNGEEANALGNHLGSYVAGIKTSFLDYDVEIIYNHLFEDGSGRNLGNTPDGRYGIFIQDQEQGKWLEAFMYEFYYTKNQSSNSPTTDGSDNYFNNNLYRSGWTYENRILGVPFITLDEERFRISNNKILVHHIGVAGTAFNSLPFQFLTSYRKNYGGKGSGETRSNVISTYLNFGFYTTFADVSLQLGTDFSSVASPNFGAGIKISKKIF